jgi:predicted dienelactone hydrolase
LVGVPPHFPCLLLSHGTGGSALQLGWLGTALAAQGYIGAGVNHHGNTSVEPYTAQGFCLWWERAQDLSAVLDHLLADARFGPRIAPTRVGAAGFSLGGYTVLIVAGGRTDLQAFAVFCSGPERDATCEDQAEFPGMLAQFARLTRVDPRVQASLRRHHASFRDPRIRAVFAMAPVLGGAFTPAGLAEVSVPVALVVGQADTVASLPTNAQRFARWLPDATLTVLPGQVGHYTFLSEGTAYGKRVSPHFCRDHASIDRAAVHKQVGRRRTASAALPLSAAPDARRWAQYDYAATNNRSVAKREEVCNGNYHSCGGDG